MLSLYVQVIISQHFNSADVSIQTLHQSVVSSVLGSHINSYIKCSLKPNVHVHQFQFFLSPDSNIFSPGKILRLLRAPGAFFLLAIKMGTGQHAR